MQIGILKNTARVELCQDLLVQLKVPVMGSSSKPPSLIDGEANLFKLGALDWGLKSVESSRER